VARRLPDTGLPPGCRRLVFDWRYREGVFSAQGDGAARLAPPDSLRLDLFMANGTFAGFVILVADSLRLPAQNGAIRYVPPVPLLWAAVGRVTVAGPDTVVRLQGDTLRAEIGSSPTWRLAFRNDGLVRMDRVDRGRLEETVEREDSASVLYRQPGARRSLGLTVQQVVLERACFDEGIWRP
jgi:hypothetical protein